MCIHSWNLTHNANNGNNNKLYNKLQLEECRLVSVAMCVWLRVCESRQPTFSNRSYNKNKNKQQQKPVLYNAALVARMAYYNDVQLKWPL